MGGAAGRCESPYGCVLEGGVTHEAEDRSSEKHRHKQDKTEAWGRCDAGEGEQMLLGGETVVAKRRVAQRGWPSQWCFSWLRRVA